MFRKTIAIAALALGAVVVVPGTANAQATTYYRLTPIEHHYACGDFLGRIVFDDGMVLDCRTGIVDL